MDKTQATDTELQTTITIYLALPSLYLLALIESIDITRKHPDLPPSIDKILDHLRAILLNRLRQATPHLTQHYLDNLQQDRSTATH